MPASASATSYPEKRLFGNLFSIKAAGWRFKEARDQAGPAESALRRLHDGPSLGFRRNLIAIGTKTDRPSG